MERAVTYLVIITRTSDGYVAHAPSFAHLVGQGRGARRAYLNLKAAIRSHLLDRIRRNLPIPKDAVIQTKTLRLDLWYLRDQEELR